MPGNTRSAVRAVDHRACAAGTDIARCRGIELPHLTHTGNDRVVVFTRRVDLRFERWSADGRLQDADSVLARSTSILRSRGMTTTVPYIERLVLHATVLTGRGELAAAEALLAEALERSRASFSGTAQVQREVHRAYEQLYTKWNRPADAARHRDHAARG